MLAVRLRTHGEKTNVRQRDRRQAWHTPAMRRSSAGQRPLPRLAESGAAHAPPATGPAQPQQQQLGHRKLLTTSFELRLLVATPDLSM